MSVQLQNAIYNVVRKTLSDMFVGRFDLAIDFTGEQMPTRFGPILNDLDVDINDVNVPGRAELCCRGNVVAIANEIPVSMLDDLYNCSEMHDAVAQIFIKYEYEVREWLVSSVSNGNQNHTDMIEMIIKYLTNKI